MADDGLPSFDDFDLEDDSEGVCVVLSTHSAYILRTWHDIALTFTYYLTALVTDFTSLLMFQVGMHNYEQYMGEGMHHGMNDEEEKIWRAAEEKFFKSADESKVCAKY